MARTLQGSAGLADDGTGRADAFVLTRLPPEALWEGEGRADGEGGSTRHTHDRKKMGLNFHSSITVSIFRNKTQVDLRCDVISDVVGSGMT